MKKGLLIFAGVVLGLGVAGCAVGAIALKGDFRNLDRHEYTTSTYEFEGDISKFNITEHITGVKIVPSNDDVTRVNIVEMKEYAHTVEVKDNVLTISENDRNFGFFDWVKNGPILVNLETTIELPLKEYASFELEDSTGSFDIKGAFSFDKMQIKLSTGSLSLDGVKANNCYVKVNTGAVEIKSSNFDELRCEVSTGSLDISDVKAKTITTKDDTGSTEFANVTAEKDINVTGSTGLIELDNVIAGERISCKSSTSGIELKGCDAPEIELRSSTGSIEAELLTGKTYDCSSDTGSVKVPSPYPEGGRLTARTSTGSIVIKVR